MSRRSPVRFLTTATAAITALLLGLGFPAPPAAHALAGPLPPTDPLVAEQWANPAVRPGEVDAGVSLVLVDAPDLRAGALTPGADLDLTLLIRNDGAEPLTDLVLGAQRAEAVNTVPQARQVLGADRFTYPYYGATETLRGSLAPGESRRVRLTVPTTPGLTGSLRIADGGVYPVLFALSGVRGEAGVSADLGTERLLLPFAPPPAGPGQEEQEPGQVPGLTLLYPISADVDILPGEAGDAPGRAPLVLRSEDLAEQLAPGGRLHRLLDSYRRAVTETPAGGALREGSCLALDPALVDTVQRMGRGYTVAQERPLPTRTVQRLRDSWTGDDDPQESTPGTGQAHAREWLSGLREVAAEGCTVALPWANAELGAVAATGDRWLMREAVERGPATLREVLDVAPETNLVIPGEGYVSEDTAPALGWADHAASTVPEQGMHQAWEAAAARHDTGGAVTAPPPATPVQVLVADNTVWQAPQVDRFAALAPGITAVTYQGSLAATLATTGPAPETVGYSNPDLRFDHRLDSVLARDRTADAALRLAAVEESGDGEEPADPLLVMPPAQLSPGTAEVLLSTTGQLLTEQQALPLPLRDYLTPDGEQAAELADLGDPGTAPATPPGSTRFGAPFPDPTTASEAEIERAGQQARHANDLTRMTVNDPVIALTRYGFTLPLRRDLLSALTVTSRRTLTGHEAAVERTDRRLKTNGVMLQALRDSVSLIPPGGVYTRASESSPLLIVAENHLPLPVDARIAYHGPPGAQLNTPGLVHIPARGSITVQMTADLPPGGDRTDLSLWLATDDGAAISSPVEVGVQTRAGLVTAAGVGLVFLVFVALAVLFRVGRQRRRQAGRAEQSAPAPAESPPPGRSRTGAGPRRRPRRAGGQAGEGTGSPRPPGGPPDP